LACDVRVMADGAALGMMQVRLGIPPAWGGGLRLVRLVGYARAIEWLAAGALRRLRRSRPGSSIAPWRRWPSPGPTGAGFRRQRRLHGAGRQTNHQGGQSALRPRERIERKPS
jgi:hypothetical protein